MAKCPQCKSRVDDGGHPEGQILQCGSCGLTFTVERGRAVRLDTASPRKAAKATRKQVEFLKNLGFKDGRSLTKSQATATIESLLAEEQSRGVNLKCPSCKGQITKRPKRSMTCPRCRAKLQHICGKLHNEAQAAAWREKEDAREQKEWLRERRRDLKEELREWVADERELAKYGEADTNGVVVTIGPTCQGAAHLNGLYIRFDLAKQFPEYLPPYEGVCHHSTCECDIEPVDAVRLRRGSLVLQPNGKLTGRPQALAPPAAAPPPRQRTQKQPVAKQSSSLPWIIGGAVALIAVFGFMFLLCSAILCAGA